jgi:Ca2+-binding RTX toxin-like protein
MISCTVLPTMIILMVALGNDRLYGGPGNDTLSGGQGGDYFRCGSGVDRITNFNTADGDHEYGDCEVK